MSGQFNRSVQALARAGGMGPGDGSDSGGTSVAGRSAVTADNFEKGSARQPASNRDLAFPRPDTPHASADGSVHPAVAHAMFGHRQRLVSSLAAWLGAADAEDVFQDACLKAVERGGSLRRCESAPAWFERIVRRAAIDYVRHADAERRVRVAFDLDPTQGPDPARPHAYHSACRCGLALVSTLRPSYADVLRRVDVEEESISDVAVTLRTSANNIRVRLHRARSEMKTRLLEWCGPCAQHGGRSCSCDDKQSQCIVRQGRHPVSGEVVMRKRRDSSSPQMLPPGRDEVHIRVLTGSGAARPETSNS